MIGQLAEQRKPRATEQQGPQGEIIDAQELAAKLRVPKTWILEQTRFACNGSHPLFTFRKIRSVPLGFARTGLMARRRGGRKAD